MRPKTIGSQSLVFQASGGSGMNRTSTLKSQEGNNTIKND